MIVATFTAETKTRQSPASAANAHRSIDDICSSPAVTKLMRSVSFSRNSASRTVDHRLPSETDDVPCSVMIAGANNGPANVNTANE